MNQLNLVVEPILNWFNHNKRELPWREDKNPYRIWISEIMLQQTRVEAVKPYFKRFMDSLPTIEDLAEVEEEKLLKLWEGLGYYNRARNLQKSAKLIVEKYQGVMPKNYDLLLELPGIGSYTAGAIGSIAYGISKPAVDGNVLRVFTRIQMDDSDILKASTKKKYEELLEKILPENHGGDFNQAIMDIGATICVPNGAPKCDICPVKHLCKSNLQQRQTDFPVKKKAKARRIEEKTILVIKDSDKRLIHKRPAKGLLANMYELPSIDGYVSKEAAIAFTQTLGYRVLRIQSLGSTKHIFSHIEWHMKGYALTVEDVGFSKQKSKKGYHLIYDKEIASDYPIPNAFSFYMREVAEMLE